MMPDLDDRGVGGRGWLGHHLVNEVESSPLPTSTTIEHAYIT